MKDRVVALIPARFDASRFKGKLMAKLKGKPVISHTHKSVIDTGLFDEVVVVTDSDIIFQQIISDGGKAIMSTQKHQSGSDRIAEVARSMNVDIVVNVQGDTPIVPREPLEKLLMQFKDSTVQVGSLMQELKEQQFIDDPNYVKVAVDKNKNSLFFSRSVIPYPRNKKDTTIYYEHIGVYAFRKQALLDFTTWPVSTLEDVEKIECLRYLENGVSLRMVLTNYKFIEIDTPEDLERAEKL